MKSRPPSSFKAFVVSPRIQLGWQAFISQGIYIVWKMDREEIESNAIARKKKKKVGKLNQETLLLVN